MSFSHLSLLALGVASPFERERVETDVMLIPEADNHQHDVMADAITARNRRSIFSEGLIWIAVQPMLARLRRCDHRMPTGVRVFAGVLIR